MKKLLAVFLIISSVAAFSIVPGMDKSLYGAEVGFWGLGAWVEGYYEEGLNVYTSEDFTVDIFAGPDVYYSFGGISDVSESYLSLRFNARALVYTDKIKFEFMGYKIYPALSLRAYLYYNVLNLSVEEYGAEESNFGIYFSPPYIMAFLARPETGKASTSWYFWPFPLIIGFTTVVF